MKKKMIIGSICLGLATVALATPFLTSCSPKSTNNGGSFEETPEIPEETPEVPEVPVDPDIPENGNGTGDGEGSDSNNGGSGSGDSSENKPNNPSEDGGETNISNAVNNYDYFVLPNKDSNDLTNRITNPFTSNKEVIEKYGSAPLPWKDDISKQDIVNMFTYMCLAWKGISVSFGERKIDCNLFNDAFVEWCSTYRKYFPYKCFDNPVPVFKVRSADNSMIFPGEFSYEVLNTDKYINKTQWYMHELDWSNYEDVYQEGVNREYYVDFITRLFRCVQPNMTDIEKFYLCAGFIVNWIKYCGNMYGPSYNENGCCADYANMYSLALNLLDIPAFPVACGYQAGAHEIVWVQLDLNGNGDKKWYASDLTWGDSDFEPYKGLFAADPWYDSKAWILFDVAVDQFTSINALTPGERLFQQDISNNLFGSPWRTIGSNTSTIGKISYGKEVNYTKKYFNYFTNSRGILAKSRNFYINGYTYYFEKNEYKPNNISLYKIKAVIGSQPEELNIELPEKYLNKLSFSKTGDYPPLVQQYGNKLFILLNPEKSTSTDYKRSILVVETNQNGINWSNCSEFEIPNTNTKLNNSYIYNFDIEIDGRLRIDYGKNIFDVMSTEYFDLGDEFKSLATFNIENNNRPEDIEIAKDYFSALISMYRNGTNKDGYLGMDVRKEFYNYMNSQTENSYNSIVNILNKYKNILGTTSVSSGKLIYSSLLSNLYMKEETGFNAYGFDFETLKMFNSPVDMIGVSDVKTKYNIYYSPNKPNTQEDLSSFTKVVSESDKPFVTLNDLTSCGFSSGSGYYYIESDKNGIKTTTNVCELRLTDNTVPYFYDKRFNCYTESNSSNRMSKITNFDDTKYDWYSENINFHFEIFYDRQLFDSKFDKPQLRLKRYNIDTNEISIVKDANAFEEYFNSTKNAYIGDINLGQVTNENHGIYFIEITTRDKTTNKEIISYTDFNFIMTNDDFENWNKDLWVNAIDNLSIFKKDEN